MERRNFIRGLIAVAIGVPIAIEGVTFGSLFFEGLFGTEEETSQSAEDGVGVGDELLPATGPAERITQLTLEEGSGDEWMFTIQVEVENTADVPYRLKLGPITLARDSEVGETVSSGDIPPGETKTLQGTWSVPADSTVRGIWAGGRTESDSVVELVPLSGIDEPA